MAQHPLREAEPFHYRKDEARHETVLLWEVVHTCRNTNPVPKSSIEVCFNLYLAAANADGISEKEESFLRKYSESLGWPYFDKNNVMPIADCCAAYKVELEKMGVTGKLAQLTAVDNITMAFKACSSDGVVSSAERAACAALAEWWGINPSKAIGLVEDSIRDQDVLINKKMSIITGNAAGKLTRTGGDGYGEGKDMYLSYERMFFTKTDIPLTVADITKQMGCFAAVAFTDGISDLEKAWIESYAMYCGADPVDFAALPAIDSIKGIIEDIATRSGFDFKQLAAEIIYNCIRCAQIDGCSTIEMAAISSIASQCGIENAIIIQLTELVNEEYTFKDTLQAKIAELVDMNVQDFTQAMKEFG